MSKIARFVIWICSKFTRVEIEQIVNGLLDVLNNRSTEVRPKDDFKEKHPNYRNFFVDPLAPLTEVPTPKQSKDYKLLLAEYQATHGKPLKTVRHYSDVLRVPELTVCPLCNAPHAYLYYNDGKKRTQLKCKVCGHLFQLGKRFRKNLSYLFCPYCHCVLFTWK
ncbi:MAG: hypothetical protein NG747_16310, partial [Candidatus Brocadia sp.]|nr:hypothetical protein [Candidatus Brocadia sp.]